MPYKKTTRRNARKGYRKKPAYRRRKSYVPRRNLRVGGFPRSKIVKLRYVDSANINATASINAVHVWRANDLYDPDFTGVGHQPSNFDTWMNIYDHFTVVGSQITIVPTLQTGTAIFPGIVGVQLTDTGTDVASQSITDVLEQPRSRYSRYTFGNDTSKMIQVKHSFSAKRFFGKKNGLIGDGTYRGSASASPTEGAYYEVFVTSPGGADPGTINCQVYIDYIAVLTEPKEALAS